MTFKTTRRSFDNNFKSRNETGFTSRSSKLQSRPGFGNEQGYFIFVLKTPVTNGIQKTDMRSKLQQRIDSSRLTIQNQLPTRKQIIAIPASDLYADALGIMNGCLDAAFLKADIGARIMKNYHHLDSYVELVRRQEQWDFYSMHAMHIGIEPLAIFPN